MSTTEDIVSKAIIALREDYKLNAKAIEKAMLLDEIAPVLLEVAKKIERTNLYLT